MSKLRGFQDRPLRNSAVYGEAAPAGFVSISATLRVPCPVCGVAAGQMCIDPETGEERSTCYERRMEAVDDGNLIGTPRMVNYALGIWPDSIISRRTLRALLPRGEDRWPGGVQRWNAHKNGNQCKKKNNVTGAFQKQLKILEDEDLIRRGTDFIQIIDRRRLFDRALIGISDPHHRKFLRLEDAATRIELELRAEQREEISVLRRKELGIIRQLMLSSNGSRDSRRRQVRQESGDVTVPLGETASRWKRSNKPVKFGAAQEEQQ